MEEKQPMSSSEIDLIYFFRPLQRAWVRIRKWLGNYYLRIVNNRLLFFSVIILITAAGYSLRYIIKPSYKTKGVFMSRMLPGKYCATLIEGLNSINGQYNLPVLAQYLHTSESAVATIKSISLSPAPELLVIDKQDTAANVFTIDLTLNEMQYVDSLQKGIVIYLENTPYAIKRKEVKIQSLLALKASLDSRLQSLDSLKKIVAQSIIPRSQGQGIILGKPIDPVNIYKAESTYFKERLDIEKQLKVIDNIEVIQPFIKLRMTNYPNYFKMLVYAFLASVLAALVITPVLGRKPKTASRP